MKLPSLGGFCSSHGGVGIPQLRVLSGSLASDSGFSRAKVMRVTWRIEATCHPFIAISAAADLTASSEASGGRIL